MSARPSAWPALPYVEWQDTCATLHRWTQIVGKVRLAATPWHIHSWHATLYLTGRGLTTSPVYVDGSAFQIDFDFIAHKLEIRTATGERRELALEPQSVADFYAALMQALESLELRIAIHGRPNEVPDPIAFAQDHVHSAYDADSANRFWRVLSETDRIFKFFRTGFLGKSSPVHFFWGSFDLAVTRFSGRPAPPHPGGIPNLPDGVTREAYSHEVSSAGFWPGGGPTDYAAFYSYAYPMPEAYSQVTVSPAEAFFSETAGEFILPYDVVRTSQDPERTLLEFLQSTYEAAADTGAWKREPLECPLGKPRIPRIPGE